LTPGVRQFLKAWRRTGATMPSPAEWNAMVAERDLLRSHSVQLNTVSYLLAEALGRVGNSDHPVSGNAESDARALIAERDALRDGTSGEAGPEVLRYVWTNRDGVSHNLDPHEVVVVTATGAEVGPFTPWRELPTSGVREAIRRAVVREPGTVTITSDCTGQVCLWHDDHCPRHNVDPEVVAWLRGVVTLPGGDEPAPPIASTSMLAAVRADLASMEAAGGWKGGMPQTTAAMALWLAEVIDAQRATASPSAVARLVDSLRQTMRVLSTGKDEGPAEAMAELMSALSTPERVTRVR
jgi:hypothetical protein